MTEICANPVFFAGKFVFLHTNLKMRMASQTEVLSEILRTSPCVELLRLRNRRLIILFLFKMFYHRQAAVPFESLRMQLADYLSAVRLEEDEESGITEFDSFEEKAGKYIQRWTDKGFLRNYQEETGEVFYELSLYTSKTIDWLLSLKREEFVGTESKFMNLFGQLKELVEFTNEDKEERIRMLEEKKREIEHQIQAIRAGGDAQTFEEYQILPRFKQISQSAKELLSDFKEVEENFKSITKDIYRRHAEGAYSKGDILGFTFDALENLQQSSQGKSFYAFWDFLLTPSLQHTWDGLVEHLYETLDDKRLEVNDTFLKNMKQYLYAAGKKVYQANDKMAEKLSRIICENGTMPTVITRQVIADIQSSLLVLAQKGITPDISLEVETLPDINMPLERRLTPERNVEITYRQALEMASSDIREASSAASLFVQNRVDRQVLKQRIGLALRRRRQVSLGEVVEENGGLREGLSELFGYIGAVRDFRHTISAERTQTVVFDEERHKAIVIPEIIVVR